MSILLSQASVAPFVQQAARALHEAGWLDRFVTTLRYNSHSRRQRLACSAAKIAGFDLERQLRRRTITELPLEYVESLPWPELLRLIAGRVDRGGRLADLAWSKTEPAFDRAVARRLGAHHHAVYGFEYSSLATFRRARELGLKTFYDMPAPEPQWVQRLLNAEAVRFPVLRTAYYHHTSAREDKRIARRHAEWEAADLVIAASSLTRDSFARAGLSHHKVCIVPYGAPPAIPVETALCGGSTAGPLRLLWAGTFGVRKGAHYLLEAWRKHSLGRHARLDVFGAVTLAPELLQPVPEGITFHGSIPRNELMPHYQNSDALIFPTLCDGFGMVVTEAWSQGLPVITTDRAGAADRLRPGQNGLLHRAGDASALAEIIMWCLEHRAELRAMRGPAQATAASWQWSDYRAALRTALAGSLPHHP